MNSIRLVLLSLVVGAAIGAGLMAWRRPASPPADALDSPFHSRAAESKPAAPEVGNKAKGVPEDGYQRVATALVTIDERISLMEAREESNLERQKRLMDQVRELAIVLEVKSGNLKPLRESSAARLEPVRGRTYEEPLIGEHPVPLSRPDMLRTPVGGEEMPEW